MEQRLKFLENKYFDKIKEITDTIGKNMVKVPDLDQKEICALIIFHTLRNFDTKAERKEICQRLDTLIEIM